MITRKQSVEQFKFCLDEVIGSNYILAEKKINRLLKVVTCSKLFYELITYCAEGFDYDKIKENSNSSQGFITDGRMELIAFGFSLLTAIDSKEEDLLEVLKNYYPAQNFDLSYKKFCDEFLLPFKNCTTEVALKMISECEELENVGITNENFDKELVFTGVPEDDFIRSRDLAISGKGWNLEPQKKYLTCHRDIQKIISNEKARLFKSKWVKEKDKNNLLSLLDKFKDCLAKGDKNDIKTAFNNYKYAMNNVKRFDSEVGDVERILRFCNIV